MTDDVEDLELLLETMIAGDGIRPRTEALPLLCAKVADVLGGAASVIRLIDADGSSLRTAAVANTAGRLEDRHLDIVWNEALPVADLSSHVVRRTGLPPSVEAFLSGEVTVITTAVPEFPLTTMCAAPLIRRGRSFGVLAVYWAQEHHPDDARLRAIRLAARMTALVLETTAASDAVASALESAERSARGFVSARRLAVHELLSPDAAATAVRQAESVLGILDEVPRVLLAALFADAEQAYAHAADWAEEAFLEDSALVASGATLIAVAADEQVAARLGRRLATAAGYLGCGSAGPLHPGGFGAALDDATTAARISRMRGGRVVAFDEIGSILSATASIPERDARALIAEVIGPLESYDADHESRLVETLETYLSLDGSITRTASRLHLHVNTVKQRLERIGSLLSADVRDYRVVARLLLALEWRSLLRG